MAIEEKLEVDKEVKSMLESVKSIIKELKESHAITSTK